MTQNTEPTDMPASGIVFEGKAGRKIRVEQHALPEFIGNIVVHKGRIIFEEEMCVRIDQRYLWEDGDTAQTLHAHYTSRENFTLSLDGVENLPPDAVQLESSLNEYIETQGSEVISYGDLSYCFNTADLGVGQHKSRLFLISPSGQTYSYSWEFEIMGG